MVEDKLEYTYNISIDTNKCKSYKGRGGIDDEKDIAIYYMYHISYEFSWMQR